MFHIVDGLNMAGFKIYIWTARLDTYRKEAEEWLDNNSVPYMELRMKPAARATDDANVVKGEWLWDLREEHSCLEAVRTGTYRVPRLSINQYPSDAMIPLLAIDDRAKCAHWWREQGTVCIDVAGNPF